MTSDDQFFFDYLASIPHDVRKYSLDVANSIDQHIDNAARSIRGMLSPHSWIPESVDRHVDNAAGVIRDTLSHQEWIPSSIRPFPRPEEVPPFTDRVQDWISRNRAWSAAILAFVGTGSVLYFGSKKFGSKRRKARKAGNGARKEIVVVAGSPHEPMTRAIVIDLERRGYIVYVTVSSAEEEQVVQSERRTDIRALWLDLATTPSSPSEIHPSLEGIRSLLTQPQWPMPGVPPHKCELSGLILVPSPNYATGPVAAVPPSTWADTVNTRLLSPILTTQLLLPLLTLRNNNSTVILVSPSISSSLSAPFAGPEVATTRALEGFATSLRRELQFLQHGNVDVVELRLGNIDMGSHGQRQVTGTQLLTWSPEQRELYGSQYMSSIEGRPVASVGPNTVRGSPARSLHWAIQDALEAPSKSYFGKTKKTVVYVGRGARTYSLIGEWIPAGLVGLMLGLRRGPAPESVSGSSSENGWEKVQ